MRLNLIIGMAGMLLTATAFMYGECARVIITRSRDARTMSLHYTPAHARIQYNLPLGHVQYAQCRPLPHHLTLNTDVYTMVHIF